MIHCPRLRATSFLRELTTGKTRPCVLGCEAEGDDPGGEFVVKLRASVEGGASGLLFEYLASRVALELGVPMPRSVWVVIEPSFAEALALGGLGVAERIRESIGLNFGTEYVAHCSLVLPDSRLDESLLSDALLIFLFDLFIDNADRRREKPNLLSDPTGALLAIDHELAFSFTRAIGGQPVWRQDLSSWRRHPLYNGLHRRVDVQALRGVVAKLGRLTEEFLRELRTGVPPELATEHLDKVFEYLQSARGTEEALFHSLKTIL